MAYTNDIPVGSNNVLDPASGDIVLMKGNFAILASLVSGMTAPSESAPMEQLLVTSGAATWGMGWTGTDATILYSGAGVADFNASTFSLTGVVLAGDVAASADTHYVRRGEVKTETLGGHIVTVASGATFVLDERAMYNYTIDELHAVTASGEVDVTVSIGLTAVTGLSGLTISGTQSSDNATAAFSVASGNRVTMALAAVSGEPSDLSFTIKTTRSA